ncbi:LuxR C-terminal-related transcriptional regulator [Candidatus Chloroploca sp. Khr17]|uniref:LuxR C-terminal-related transcriptional regulator n=1 Tax=Candidatus Chloroploca sp. Khr17 TaxID=2496869 RepID=UPI0013EB3E68|nr:LuxR C-terminal-related transcriptional regulator [Candidatus Chloroploca sp. Khr17]
MPVLPGTLRLRVSLQITLLLRTQRYDEAWHLASGLGVDLESDPASKSHSLLIPFLQAYIARGLNLAAISPLLKRGLQWYSQTGDCFNELWLLTFRAWQQLRLGRRRDALVALDQALQLANATGYTQVVREIPELLPLVDQGVAQLLRVHDSIGSDSTAPTAAWLTHQEQAVLRLLAEDYRYEQIAHVLTISVNTVRTHIRNSYAKLGVNRRAGAIARARKLGLL